MRSLSRRGALAWSAAARQFHNHRLGTQAWAALEQTTGRLR